MTWRVYHDARWLSTRDACVPGKPCPSPRRVRSQQRRPEGCEGDAMPLERFASRRVKQVALFIAASTGRLINDKPPVAAGSRLHRRRRRRPLRARDNGRPSLRERNALLHAFALLHSRYAFTATRCAARRGAARRGVHVCAQVSVLLPSVSVGEAPRSAVRLTATASIARCSRHFDKPNFRFVRP